MTRRWRGLAGGRRSPGRASAQAETDGGDSAVRQGGDSDVSTRICGWQALFGVTLAGEASGWPDDAGLYVRKAPPPPSLPSTI